MAALPPNSPRPGGRAPIGFRLYPASRPHIPGANPLFAGLRKAGMPEK
jgi:hypothetical protein